MTTGKMKMYDIIIYNRAEVDIKKRDGRYTWLRSDTDWHSK